MSKEQVRSKWRMLSSIVLPMGDEKKKEVRLVLCSNRLIIAVAMVLALVTACTPQQSGGFDPETLLTIEEPRDGAQVSVPVSVRLSSNATIGQERSVQVYINGLEGPRVSQKTFELTDLKPGDNAIAVSLLNEDGSPAGGEDSIHVTVTG